MSAEHGTSVRTYTTIFLVLLVLVAVTVGAAYVQLGRFNVIVALTIASVKTFLVMAWFMHLRQSSRLTWVLAMSGFAFLALLVGSLLVDFALR